jgi:predicted HicB family RNase H-like nuclease
VIVREHGGDDMKRNYRHLLVRLPEPMHAALHLAAQQDGEAVAVLVRQALAVWLSQRQADAQQPAKVAGAGNG